MHVALLADHLRVEERLLTAAFAARGHTATLVSPARLTVALRQPMRGVVRASGSTDPEALAQLVLNRGVATPDRATLGALVAAAGATVVNRPATARLLADRLALLRHLLIAGIPVPEAVVCFGEEATLDAVEMLGYPVILKSLTTHPVMPVALVEDRDAAEAIIEHRTTLGNEQSVLVQRFLRGNGHVIRLVVVGVEIVGIESRPVDIWRPARDASFGAYEQDGEMLRAVGRQVIARLGSGVYAIDIVIEDGRPVVIGAANLVDFRTLSARGIDVAGAIADFALDQVGEQTETWEEGDNRG